MWGLQSSQQFTLQPSFPLGLQPCQFASIFKIVWVLPQDFQNHLQQVLNIISTKSSKHVAKNVFNQGNKRVFNDPSTDVLNRLQQCPGYCFNKISNLQWLLQGIFNNSSVQLQRWRSTPATQVRVSKTLHVTQAVFYAATSLGFQSYIIPHRWFLQDYLWWCFNTVATMIL